MTLHEGPPNMMMTLPDVSLARPHSGSIKMHARTQRIRTPSRKLTCRLIAAAPWQVCAIGDGNTVTAVPADGAGQNTQDSACCTRPLPVSPRFPCHSSLPESPITPRPCRPIPAFSPPSSWNRPFWLLKLSVLLLRLR
jgi:hypothetical protein